MAVAGCRRWSVLPRLFGLGLPERKLLQQSRIIPGLQSTQGHQRALSSAGRTDNDVRGNVKEYDVVVVGAGIVGLATARELATRYPSLKYAIVDKEQTVAAHQSSHNSGVIHAGIYYTPGSLKARLCVQGLKLMYKYCDENDVPYNKCGKLIVAVTPEEADRLSVLYDRGIQNEVPDLRLVGPEEIREIEPHCRGFKAIHSPHTGITDFGAVTKSYAKSFRRLGGTLHLGFKVTDFKESEESLEYPVTIQGSHPYALFEKQLLRAKYVIVCGGLHADRLAEKSGCDSVPKIVPFRGEYLLLKPEKKHLVRGNIYPVPDPRFPFLGVHFTPRINGDVWLGPNAVLAFKREGYRLVDFSPLDLIDALAFSGLRRLVSRNVSYAFGELYRGIHIAAQVEKLKKYVPELQTSDVVRGPAGVRAMALAEDGSLVEDFVFDRGEGQLGARMLHVRNAPSPAATSSLAIAQMVANKAGDAFKLAG